MPKSPKLNAESKKTAGRKDYEKEEINEAKKKKLLLEIRALKLLITQNEYRTRRTSFKDLSLKEMSDAATKSNCFSEITDVQAELQNDLCRYAGFSCERVGDKFIFYFESLHGESSTFENWIQIVKDEDKWRLGEWVMPLGLDASEIFSKYSTNSDIDMKLFLKECKRLVECYNQRERQVRKLETFMNHMENHGCSVESNYRYNNLTMKLVTKPKTLTNDSRIILVYLVYDMDKTRPSKIRIDCEGDEELSRDVGSELIRYFQSFKDLDLIEAAKKTLTSPKSPFVWKDSSIDDTIIDIKEDDINKILPKLLQKTIKTTRKRGRENEETNDRRQKNKKPKLATLKNEETIEEKSVAKKIATATKEISNKSEPRRTSLPLSDCNINIVSSISKNFPTGKNEERIKRSSLLNFFKPNAESMKNSYEVEETEIPQKNIEKIDNNPSKIVISASTPKSNSSKMLLCSTPIPEYSAVLSTIREEENISAIAKIDTKNLRRTINAETADRDSDELEEEDEIKDYSNNSALLKDLRDFKYNNNNRKKFPTIKRILKASRGRKKIAKN